MGTNPKLSETTGDIANFLPINGGEVVVPDNLATTVAASPLLQANYNAFLVSFNACNLPSRNTALACSKVVTASQAGLPSSLGHTYWGDYDPRISVAFRPFSNNKTVFRAGFGIFTNTMLGPFAYTSIGIPLGAPYTYSNDNSGTPLFQFPATSPTNQGLQYGGSGFYDAYNPNFKDPQTAQWNVTIEREVGANTALRISYVGMNTYRLNITEDYNAIPPSTTPYVPSPYVDPRAPFQNWIQLYVSQNAGFANYQGLTLEATHRMARGLSFQANYTYAKDLSSAQGDAPGGFVPEVLLFTPTADQFDTRLGRGNVAGQPQQRFLLTGTYQLPFGTGKNWQTKNRFVNGALGGLECEHGHSPSDGALAHPHHQPHRRSIEHRHRRPGWHHSAARRSRKSQRPERRLPVEPQCLRSNANECGKNRECGCRHPGWTRNALRLGGIGEGLSHPRKCSNAI